MPERGQPDAAPLIEPEWSAPTHVRALVTTRAFGDMREGGAGRSRLRPLLPAEPLWLRQVHGREVACADAESEGLASPQADACVARERGRVCAVLTADCLPVLLASRTDRVIGIAHAGWRGLAAGVIESTLAAMTTETGQVAAWLGPAIGASAYEVGAEVREAFLTRDARAEAAFAASRDGHWYLDLYAIARQRLGACGVTRISCGGFCTYHDAERFFSWRRERTAERMAALIWIA